jgi:hypothetical protein
MISERALVYPNVRLGKNCVIEDFAIAGATPAGRKPGELGTGLGDGAASTALA